MGQKSCTLYFETLIELFGLLLALKGYRYPSCSTNQYLFNLFCYADVTSKPLLCRECAFVGRLVKKIAFALILSCYVKVEGAE
jgi:hypothetical protein